MFNEVLVDSYYKAEDKIKGTMFVLVDLPLVLIQILWCQYHSADEHRMQRYDQCFVHIKDFKAQLLNFY